MTVDESDEAFANVYSTAVSLQNVLPRVSQRLLIVASAVVATAGALVLDLSDFATFLFLLGSFFVPLLGVLIADWLLEGRHYTRETIFHGPAFRPEMIARLARRLRPLPVALAAGAGLVDATRRPHRPGADRLHRLAAELRRRVRARLLARAARPGGLARAFADLTS